MNAPGFALNPLSVRAFNALYFWNGSRQEGQSIVDWDGYFYPLDAILKWNRLYGRKGVHAVPMRPAERHCARRVAPADVSDFRVRPGVVPVGPETLWPAGQSVFPSRWKATPWRSIFPAIPVPLH